MKKLMLMLSAITMFAVAQNANAISLRFKFKTFSSGPSMYACNAGIMTPQVGAKVCYFEGTKNTCTPTTCDNTQAVCDTRCVCTGDNGGDYLMNYGKVDYQDWKDNGDTTAATGKGSATFSSSGSTSAWNQAYDDSQSWGRSISNLSFNLGSELYGAKYFVDICYRGPQIEYFEDGVTANFNLKAQANATDFLANGVNGGDNNRDGLVIPGTVDGKKYTELAGLKVQAFVVCDKQGEGSYKYARNNQGQYNTTANEANFVLNNQTGLPTSGGDLFVLGSIANLGTGNVSLVDGWVNQNTHTPRFCKIRYVFTETNATATLPNLRKWQRHGAEMCTFTDIEEASDASGLN
ncbi:protease [Bdellovibrio sp. NC01]|uniref:protease n=1 Tax=Bdellovibrio sp. NC01 TaxID=2220073 RepID=UPI0011598E1A|nr:protease [Bdellovibrio sp. NC01]QDK37258.1 protease [Bdellovibrio sp. NC01]